MARFKAVNKFYRRYEVDLWGKLSGQGNNKTVRFLEKVRKEKLRRKNFQGFEKVRKKKTKDFKQIKQKNKLLKKIALDKKKRQQKNKNKIKSKKFKRGKRRKNSTASHSGGNKNKNKNKSKVNNNKRRNSSDYNKYKQPFFYRIDYADPQRRKPKTSLSRELFLVKNKLLRYYNNIKKHQLRSYANTKTFKIKFKLVRGLGDKNISKYNRKTVFKKLLALDAFFSLVEHRLDVMLYRSNLVETIKQARQLIKHGHVLVNGLPITYCGLILKNFSVVSLDIKIQKRMFNRLVFNVERKRLPLYPPSYIYTDFTLMKSTILFNPTTKNIPFPFKIDLSKWLGLAKHMF